MGTPLDTLIHGVRFVWRGTVRMFQRKHLVFDPATFTLVDDPDAADGDGATVVTGTGGGATGGGQAWLRVTAPSMTDIDLSSDLGTVSVIEVSGTFSLSGFTKPSAGVANVLWIRNTGAHDVTILDAAPVTAGNGVAFGDDASDFPIAAGFALGLEYSHQAVAWIPFYYGEIDTSVPLQFYGATATKSVGANTVTILDTTDDDGGEAGSVVYTNHQSFATVSGGGGVIQSRRVVAQFAAGARFKRVATLGADSAGVWFGDDMITMTDVDGSWLEVPSNGVIVLVYVDSGIGGHEYWTVMSVTSAPIPLASTAGNLLTSDGVRWKSVASRLPATGVAGKVLTSDGTNWISASAAEPSTLSKWRTGLDLDFRAQANQTMATDTTYTIAGLTWTKRNSANDRVAMAIVNGTGLVIQPGATGNWFGNYTCPVLDTPLSAILTTYYAIGMPVRLTAYISAQNSSANFDTAVIGISNRGAAGVGYTFKRQWDASQGFELDISAHSQELTATPHTTSNDVIRLMIPAFGEPHARGYIGGHGTSPEIPTDSGFNMGPIPIFDRTWDLSAMTKANAGIGLGAFRSGSASSTFSVTIARIVLEYFGPAA